MNLFSNSSNLTAAAKMIGHFKDLSITRKFAYFYVAVFALPILLYASYSFQSANESIKTQFSRQSLENLEKACNNILRNEEICENVAQTSLVNTTFIEFASGDMLSDDVALIGFRQKEYNQIVNIKNINPGINNIKFYMANEKIYEIPPILNEEKMLNRDFVKKIKTLQGKQYFKVNSTDNDVLGVPIRVVSLYREIITDDMKHKGIIEVNMPLKSFFSDLFDGYLADGSSMLLVVGKGNREDTIFNVGNAFHKSRSNNFTNIVSGIQSGLLQGKESFRFLSDKEEFFVASKYNKKLDAYICIVYSLKELTRKLDANRLRLILGVLVAIVILFLFIYFSTAILLKKLGMVVSYIRKVQAGNFKVEIPVKGGDEIDELAKHFNQMLYKMNDLISEVVKKETVAKEAEVKALQSQINSHFINNVLESIRMLAEVERKPHIADAIASLGKLMRYSMNWKSQEVLLSEEVNLVESYILLMNIINEMDIKLELSIENELMDYKIPKMSIQPIVENAVNHGIEPGGKSGAIRISAVKADDTVHMEIYDDGQGMDAERLGTIRRIIEGKADAESRSFGKNGIGLLNVHKRIHMFYGKDFGLTIESEKAKYTKVNIHLPYEKSLGGW